ncbi:tripartite tricarboxylate transporter substrate binding protein [Variovorax sp. Sphag1AA]|uniref:Bug family tripartite tricarboxylate transporter substrate binding protein n=1 Tax=Variovorax sp. Sphag1AA TaxID=2587027 RepID=UPI00160EF7AC|nr:tripartite tricarboxylate transporter substrate binding protein [Variovorax sp. Sphag1AA]MBB3178444.1 tripartite-type tricarboxylate transporter receptor subunit TctC [Variovorax sp. Sphag1AA]
MSARPHDGDFRARRRACLGGLGAFALAGAMPAAFAQQPSTTFPSRVVRIVPFGTAGGPIDVIARVYADKLQQRWGQSVIVEPKPGASGIIASDAVAKAPPDGHTVLFTLPLTHINNAILQAKLPYDPVKDFEPITQLASGGPMLVAPANAPYSNLKEFVAYAKAHPGMTYGTWGNGSQAHLMGELLKRQAGIELTHVAYKAEAAAHTDMIGGVLDFAWANPSTARVQSQAGKMKVLGIAGSRRVSTLPNVPTFAEQGFAGFDLDSWIGVYAPAKTPTAVIEQWNQALREITRMPEVQSRLIAFGFEPLGNTPAQFRASYQADFPRVAELIKAAGVTAE